MRFFCCPRIDWGKCKRGSDSRQGVTVSDKTYFKADIWNGWKHGIRTSTREDEKNSESGNQDNLEGTSGYWWHG